jgi:hypothetical protein
MVNIFTPNCTTPPTNSTHFVSNPNVRGTLDIVWSCLAIVFLCTWSILHPNVPPQVRPRNMRHVFKRAMARTGNKIKSMLIAVLMPEVLFSHALVDLAAIWEQTPILKKVAEEDTDKHAWTFSHTFLANMGGIVLEFPDQASGMSTRDDIEAIDMAKPRRIESKQNVPTATGKHLSKKCRSNLESIWKSCSNTSYGDPVWALDAENEEMVEQALTGTFQPSIHIPHSFRQLLDDNPPMDWLVGWAVLAGNIWVLNAMQLHTARKLGLIASLPDISEDEIDDKSDSDFIVKSLALLQIFWLVIQLGVRTSSGLPATQLEVMTLAFGGCMFGICLILWRKPRNVTTPIYVLAERRPDLTDALEIWMDSFNEPYLDSPPWISNNTVYMNSRRRIIYGCMGGSIGALIFGVMHLLSWNFLFPTPAERLCWRIASSITIVFPVVFCLGAYVLKLILDGPMRKGGKPHPATISKIEDIYLTVSLLPGCIYIVARLFIMVEVMRCLYFAPPGAFISTWTSHILHLG